MALAHPEVSLSEAVRASSRRGSLGQLGSILRESKATGLLLIVLVLLLWEWLARSKTVDLPSFPAMSSILVKWWELVRAGDIPAALLPTLVRLVLGFLLAVLLGVPAGAVMGFSKQAYNLLEPITESLRPIPASALIPILILFLGIEDAMKISLIAFASFFPILLNTFSGVRAVDPVLIQTARTLGLSKSQIIRDVQLPAALPYVFTGMRISVAVSLVLAVVAEMVAGHTGIGYFTLRAENTFQVTSLYAGILTLGVVGYMLNRLFLLIERNVLRWHIEYSRCRS